MHKSEEILIELEELCHISTKSWSDLQKRSDMTDNRSAKNLTKRAWRLSYMSWVLYRDYMNENGLSQNNED